MENANLVGELLVRREKFPNTYKIKLYFLSSATPPLKKGGRKGDLNFSQLPLRERRIR
jgi:hypothetical protein